MADLTLDLSSLTFSEPTGTIAQDARWSGFLRSSNKVFFLRYAAKCSFCNLVFEARPSRLAHHFLAPKDGGHVCKVADEEFIKSYRAKLDSYQMEKKNFYSVQEKKDCIDAYLKNSDITVIVGMGYEKVSKKLITKWIDDFKKVEEEPDRTKIQNSSILFELEVNSLLSEQKKQNEERPLNLKTIRKCCSDVAKSDKFSKDCYIHKLKFSSAYLSKRFKKYMNTNSEGTAE